MSDYCIGKATKVVEESLEFNGVSRLSDEDSVKLRENVSGTMLHWPFLYLTVNSNSWRRIPQRINRDEGLGWLKTQVRAAWSVITSNGFPSR